MSTERVTDFPLTNSYTDEQYQELQYQLARANKRVDLWCEEYTKDMTSVQDTINEHVPEWISTDANAVLMDALNNAVVGFNFDHMTSTYTVCWEESYELTIQRTEGIEARNEMHALSIARDDYVHKLEIDDVPRLKYSEVCDLENMGIAMQMSATQ
jgi:hypothetical protein